MRSIPLCRFGIRSRSVFLCLSLFFSWKEGITATAKNRQTGGIAGWLVSNSCNVNKQVKRRRGVAWRAEIISLGKDFFFCFLPSQVHLQPLRLSPRVDANALAERMAALTPGMVSTVFIRFVGGLLSVSASFLAFGAVSRWSPVSFSVSLIRLVFFLQSLPHTVVIVHSFSSMSFVVCLFGRFSMFLCPSPRLSASRIRVHVHGWTLATSCIFELVYLTCRSRSAAGKSLRVYFMLISIRAPICPCVRGCVHILSK